MSRLECERWASLLDREALEGTLSRDEVAFQAAHTRVCQQCAQELASWRELRTLQPLQASALDRDVALEESVLARLWQEPAAPRAARPQRAALAKVGLVLAAAAAVLVFFALQRRPDSRPQPTQAHATIASGRALSDGGSQQVAEAVTVGSRLRAGDQPLCLLIEPAVRACLSPGGELRVADLSFAHRSIELLQGRLVSSLDPQPAGTTFSVATAATTVTAVGTIFTVEVGSELEQVSVRVLRGSVKVRSKSQPERVLRAQESLAFGAPGVSGVSPAQEASDLELLRLDPPTPAASIGAAPSVPTTGPDEVPSARPSTSIAPVPSQASAPDALLREALELRGAGRYRDAAQVYRRLVGQHPASPEARAAWLSLGDLQLSRLGDPAGALRSFDTYLKSGDRALVQEAEYGRIRALRALGSTREEAQAIERLLARYPSGVHAKSMRARLHSLQGDASP